MTRYQHHRSLHLLAPVLATVGFLFAPSAARSQELAKTTAKANWQNLDLQTDSVFGVSTERAYKELLGSKKATPIRVAVIDGGIDVAHPALLPNLWNHNRPNSPKTHEGYAGDEWGWNFIGSAKGNVSYDNLEMTRLIRKMKPKYETITDTSTLSPAERDSLRMFRKMYAEFSQELIQAQRNLKDLEGFQKVLDSVVQKIGKPVPTLRDFQEFRPASQSQTQVARSIMNALTQIPDFTKLKAEQIDKAIAHLREQVDYQLNLAFDPRYIVADDTLNPREHAYGNADVVGTDAGHGTHVAGIIGSARTKDAVVMGVADAVEIITVRAVPQGDERDKDVANAIRYAVDHGARIINMSFGKSYGANKQIVDEAVKYAMSKNVLLIHAAGNDAQNIDDAETFPNPVYADGTGTAEAWIEVGASGWKNNETLAASFSNYGQKRVDLFAPGVRINSTTPGGKYAEADGTSMAAPVVSGVAALVWSRYPNLTAVQVKDILMKSVVKVDQNVMILDKATGRPRSVPFASLSVAGGVVNAYNALKLAAQYGK